MSFDIDKIELARRITEAYGQLAGLIDLLSPEQMERPHAIGALSIKDLLAHLIAHEQRALQELRAARQGRPLMIDHAANNAFNAGAVAAAAPIDTSSIRAAWERSVQQVLAAIQALPDADFLPNSALTQILEDSIDGALGNNTYGHYIEHRPEVEAWLDNLEAGRGGANDGGGIQP
ncbi:MAG TPA: DinB family protein [Herpetosiphonaceae bacterium]